MFPNLISIFNGKLSTFLNYCLMDVAAFLKDYLKRNSLSVPKLAVMLDIPKDRIYKWIKGTKPSDPEDYRKLEMLKNGNMEYVPRGTVQSPRISNARVTQIYEIPD